MVISNYALTELEKTTFDLYFDSIVKRSNDVYLTCNPGASEAYSAKDLRKILTKTFESDRYSFTKDFPMNHLYPENFVFTKWE